MAGVMTQGDEGKEVGMQSVPSIGGNAQVVASAHLSDANRANGVAYPEAFGAGPQGAGYPAGTAMVDSSPSDYVN